ncbi:MAG: hypothetical protein JOY91_16960 [Sinobacteraceae bacterium]|nr:hypothetical protein [Nevskiaceae bacterium]
MLMTMDTRCGSKWRRLPAFALLALLQCVAAHAAAPDDRVNVLEKKLDQTLELVRELSARVHELETQVANGTQPAPGSPQVVAAPAAGTKAAPPGPQVVAAPPAPQPDENATRIAALEQEVSQMAAGAARPTDDSGLPTHGFADVGVGNHNAQFPQYKGFDIAELDFFLTPRLGPRTRALFELNFEVGEDGTVGVDLERAHIGYQFADSATVWLGRFHTPFGYYNTAFHHGQEIATSLRRPRFLEFEDHGGVMPAHTVGAWLTGYERLGDSKLTYDLFTGNSQAISGGTIDMRNPGNTNGNLIVGGNVGWLPNGPLDGLKFGVSAFSTRIEIQDVAPEVFTRVTNYGVYAVYDTDLFEALTEFYLFHDQDLSGHTGTHRSDAGFAQLGYRAGRYIPYIRYERAALQQSDPYFAAQHFGESYYREALGLRFDIDVKSALKVEFANTQLTDRRRTDFGEALIQYAIRF